MNRCLLPAILLLLLVSGCQTQPLRSSSDQDLQGWIDRELVPYLSRQLATHPRFRDEPVLLVSMRGDDIQPHIDDLTRALRRQLKDALLDQPGIRIPWEPARRENRHHRRLSELRCQSGSRASHYIGIQFTPLVSGDYRVSIRALDLNQREWIAGFGRHWQGRLSQQEQRALQRRRPDEALRGLRPLPFTADQADLAADYLANNLGCLLRQQADDEMTVYVAPVADRPAQLSAIRRLLDNNLARYREVLVTGNRGEADFLLNMEAQVISSGVYQIWISLTPEKSGRHLTGLDTSTYITSAEVPAIARALRAEARRRVQVSWIGLDQRDDSDCAGDGVGIDSMTCFDLTLKTRGSGQLFLIEHTPGSGASRLIPGCRVARGPSNGSGERVYRIDSLALQPLGKSTLYAITAMGDRNRSQLEQHLRVLPAACQSSSDRGLKDVALEHWLARLDQLVEQNPGRTHWLARRTPGR